MAAWVKHEVAKKIRKTLTMILRIEIKEPTPRAL